MLSTRNQVLFGTKYGGVVTWRRNVDSSDRRYGAVNCTACGGHEDHMTHGQANVHAGTCTGIPPVPASPPTPEPQPEPLTTTGSAWSRLAETFRKSS
ncbi:hypothetical protein [Nonomuraea sp. NPDC023979]|uniref:hypothetical protein n=1 Tax=Nonomuraea sp. NPDC023979 TaxID=3154796 RepID=UPI0033D16D2A